MNRSIVRFAAAVALLAGTGSPAASADYDWAPMRIGGAGWVTGIAVHPTSPGVVYVRTDVGGAYRWGADEKRWEQLLVDTAVDERIAEDYDVESVAIAPTDDRVVYLAVGADRPDGDGEFDPQGSVLKSTDGGRTFSRSARRWIVSGNAERRQGGERLAVDPANADTVFFGTRHEGLWVSRDAGSSWRRVPAVPAGETDGFDAVGIKLVLFDPLSATDGETARLYASVSGEGIWRSDDNGRSWRAILGADAGTGFDAAVSARGELVVVFDDTREVRRYDPDTGRWLDITPPLESRFSIFPLMSIGIDPFDPDRLIVAQGGVKDGRLFRSLDNGLTWDKPGVALDVGPVAWREGYSSGFLSPSTFAFDPTDPGLLWFPEGFGVLRTRDLSDAEVTFELVVDGIEELVGTDIVAPPGGRPVSSHLDVALFRHPTPGGPTFDAEQAPSSRFNSAHDVDYSVGTPEHLVAVVQDFRVNCCFDGRKNESGFSTDGGRSWRLFPSIENGTHPPELFFGNIAVAANDTERLVWLPSADAPVHFSDDGGATWREAFIPGASGTETPGSHRFYFFRRRVLAADPVLDDTFYLYHDDVGVTRSTDGGETWEAFGFGPLLTFAFVNARLKAAPGRAGHLWFTPGLMNGLVTDFARSTDGGESWTVLDSIRDVEAFGFGKGVPGGYPTLYASGKVDGRRGLWRSTDEGASWEDIGFPLGLYKDIVAIDGDEDVFGTVYVNFGGNGTAVGRDDAPPSAGADCDVAAGGITVADNEWRMLALPCAPPAGAATIAAVLGDDVPGVYGTDWVVFAHDGSIPPPASPYTDPGADGTLRAGQGFWLIHRTGADVTLDMPAGSAPARGSVRTGGGCVPVTPCVATPLAVSGAPLTWTLAGNPKPASASFDDLRVAGGAGVCAAGCRVSESTAAELTLEGFFTYGGRRYAPLVTDGSTLEPWTGYWVATRPAAADAGGLDLLWPTR